MVATIIVSVMKGINLILKGVRKGGWGYRK